MTEPEELSLSKSRSRSKSQKRLLTNKQVFDNSRPIFKIPKSTRNPNSPMFGGSVERLGHMNQTNETPNLTLLNINKVVQNAASPRIS